MPKSKRGPGNLYRLLFWITFIVVLQIKTKIKIQILLTTCEFKLEIIKLKEKKLFNKMSDYESDEAPEAVDFTTSKKLVLDEVKAAAEAIKQSKQKQKDTWKKRDEANK